MKSFFQIIGLMMLIVTIFELYIGISLLDMDTCDRHASSPIVSGITLLVSFLFNMLWVTNRKGGTMPKGLLLRLFYSPRFAILIWTLLVTIGVAAAGGAIVQTYFFKDTHCNADTNIGLHFVCIITLVLSISLPHAIIKDKNKTVSPVTMASSDPGNGVYRLSR